MNKINIPNFIQASSPSLLMEKMLQNSIRLSADVKYFDISFDGKNWIAWYYEEVSLTGLLAKANNNSKKVK